MSTNADAQPIQAEIGKTINPTTASDNVAVVFVAPTITTVSVYSNIEVNILEVSCVFFDS